PAGAAGAAGFLTLLYDLTIINKTKPTITRLMRELIQAPYLIALSGFVTLPSAAMTASDSTICISEKSMPPVKNPTMGIIMSLTNPFTTRPTAPANNTATAKSMTLPVMIKFLNYYSIIVYVFS